MIHDRPQALTSRHIPTPGAHTVVIPAQGFRFVRIEFHDLGGPIRVNQIAARAVWTFLKRDGDFQCSDARFQRVWQTSAYTARLCTRPDRLDDKQADFRFEPGDYRFTAGQEGSVYVWALCPPPAGKEFVVRSLGRDAGLLETPLRQVIRLGSNQPLAWRMEADGLHVRVSENANPAEIQGYQIRC